MERGYLSSYFCRALIVALIPSQLLVVLESAADNRITIRQAATAEIPNLEQRLAFIEKTIEQRRKNENIPGLALVIVAGDKVVYINGSGLRDVEQRLPVTQDTLFEIGSTTKAFTAMAAMITVDEGKLLLDDSPKKYLPYFKLSDPEADARVTIRDLLSHRTGLAAYTDDVWLKNEGLSREEVIKRVMMSKPTARFREKFQYNNVMYTAAGECVAKAQNSTWEAVIRTRILEPLEMTSSATSLKEIPDSTNFSQGYISSKNPRAIKRRDYANIAPAGAVISDVKDMAQWLKLMIGRGVVGGKRLVSEASFTELVSKQISLIDDVGYALGWGVQKWHGRELISHTGGTLGFSSQVELMPERKLGYVLLCNLADAKLIKEIRGIIWGGLLDIQ